MKLPILTLALALLTAAPTLAQYGPDFARYRQYDGAEFFEQYGQAVTGGGDYDGDGVPDYAVGAAGASPNGLASAGKVDLYSGATGELIRTFEGQQFSGFFGAAIADLGDVNGDGIADIAVTSSNYSPTFSFTGSVQILSGADGSELHFFDASGQSSQMGIDIDSAGDINGDGINDLIVGESRVDLLGTGPIGAAYVYSGFDGRLIDTFPGPASGSGMGAGVAGAGDVNGDGRDDVVVGALNVNIGAFTFVGEAYVYSGMDGSLIHRVSGTTAFENFGVSVDGVGDLDGDGFAEIAVGSPGNDDQAPDSGAVFVYSGQTGAQMYALYGVFFDFLGRQVDGPGDCNGDGVPDILAGAFGPGAANDWRGTMQLFSGADGSQLLRVDGDAAGDYMGFAVSGVGDLNGDGANEILVGATRVVINGISFVGRTFLYGLDPNISVNTDRISNAAGGTLNFAFDLPSDAANYEYKVLISLNGRGPTFYNIDIPLGYDFFLVDSWFGDYPFNSTTGMQGILDANGDGAASITIPPNQYGFAVGRSMYVAAVAVFPGFDLPTHTTGSIRLTLID